MKDILLSLGINHTPYDARHAFATRLDELAVPKDIIKVLMGHSLSGDVTSNVYIHYSRERLICAVKQLYYIEKGVK